MKYVQINMTCGAWADSVILKKHWELVEQGDEAWFFWGRGQRDENEHLQRCNTDFGVYCDWLLSHIDGKSGFHSKAATKKLIKKLALIDPDVVHLHVLTGYYIDIDSLFKWLLGHHCKVIMTLHDCWDFTGHCIYFTYSGCTQWLTGCATSSRCAQKREYPEAWFAGDARVRKNYERKKSLLTALPSERVELITPSKWLADLVKQSYLGKYKVSVVRNTVNTSVFKPSNSTFRNKHKLERKFIVLGVASKWSQRKGLDDFVRVSSRLDKNRFAIVIVGLSEKQIKALANTASNIIALPRTSTTEELVNIYSACDVLFNPTKEDNYPTVNLEAEACGTPVITYDTGGCSETIRMPKSHVVQDVNEAIIYIQQLRYELDKDQHCI